MLYIIICFFSFLQLKLNKIDMLVNMDEVKRLGILVDREDTNGEEDGNPK